jgi:hypothetical protein
MKIDEESDSIDFAVAPKQRAEMLKLEQTNNITVIFGHTMCLYVYIR